MSTIEARGRKPTRYLSLTLSTRQQKGMIRVATGMDVSGSGSLAEDHFRLSRAYYFSGTEAMIGPAGARGLGASSPNPNPGCQGVGLQLESPSHWLTDGFLQAHAVEMTATVTATQIMSP